MMELSASNGIEILDWSYNGREAEIQIYRLGDNTNVSYGYW